MYPPIPAGLSREKHVARLSLKSRQHLVFSSCRAARVLSVPEAARRPQTSADADLRVLRPRPMAGPFIEGCG